MTAPGWYPDSDHAGQYCWWDGVTWTSSISSSPHAPPPMTQRSGLQQQPLLPLSQVPQKLSMTGQSLGFGTGDHSGWRLIGIIIGLIATTIMIAFIIVIAAGVVLL